MLAMQNDLTLTPQPYLVGMLEERPPALHQVLMADPDRKHFAVVYDIAENLGFDFHWVTSVEDALEILEFRPSTDIVITASTLRMPDGTPLCDYLKRDTRWHSIHTILLAERGSEQGRVDALAAGADDYLAKPVDPIELRSRLQVGLKLRRTIQAVRHLEQRNTVLATTIAVAHEINNSLCVLLGDLELVREDVVELGQKGVETDGLVPAIDRVCKEANSIAHFVKRLREIGDVRFVDFAGRRPMLRVPD